ncbi:MAG TPA: Gfo/Idh/MocA family oxidoreductase, partial [Chitinophagaceae bacterium]|nr:Gfo/Idh/MocA family oxidoreductase [Chitinophagaceae bacterium]
MQNENSTDESTPVVQNEDGSDTPGKKSLLSRREFVGMTAISAAGFTILPRYVLGGKGFVAPSDTISLAYIGVGSQGTRELCDMLQVPRIRVVAVCDPNKKARGYRDWGPTDLRDQIRETIQDPNWTPGGDHLIPGGRDNAKEVIDTYYKNVAKLDQYNGCKAYANVHELFDKEKGIDAVKIMTPDHLHGILCIAAMKRGKNVLVHKPISNRLLEGKKVIEMARNKPNLITHLIPWDSNGDMTPVMNWINAGAIGTLTEIHNWTNRPVWPQYDQLPTDKPPIPDG